MLFFKKNKEPLPNLLLARVKEFGVYGNLKQYEYIKAGIRPVEKHLHEVINSMITDATPEEIEFQEYTEHNILGGYSFINKARLEKLRKLVKDKPKNFRQDITEIMNWLESNLNNESCPAIFLIKVEQDDKVLQKLGYN